MCMAVFALHLIPGIVVDDFGLRCGRDVAGVQLRQPFLDLDNGSSCGRSGCDAGVRMRFTSHLTNLLVYCYRFLMPGFMSFKDLSKLDSCLYGQLMAYSVMFGARLLELDGEIVNDRELTVLL